jgi:hexokinase
MSKVVDLSSVVPQIGFTFSFPINQTGIAEGTLLRWSKAFTCPDGIGSNPVMLLKAAFRRKVSPQEGWHGYQR